MNGPEVYGTVFALGPGKTNVNVLWAGSDDGLVHVTRDGGKTWTNVTPKDMPEFGRVSQIDASAFDPGGAYIAVKKPLLNDFAPYIFRTHDYGRTWTKIVNGIGPNDYTHVVREDPTRRGLLYAGTQHGVYVSYNDGDTWKSLSLNLPVTPDFGSRRRVELAGDRHARPRLLRPRRSQCRAAGTGSGGVHGCRGPVQAGGRRPRRRTGNGHLSPEAAAESLTVEILDGAGRVVQTIPGRMGGPGRGGRGRGDAAPASAPGAAPGAAVPGAPTAASGGQAAGQGRANQPAATAADESEQLGAAGAAAVRPLSHR